MPSNRDRFWQIVAGVAGVLAIAATVTIFIIDKFDQSRGLQATLLSSSSLVNSDVSSTSKDLTLLYKGVQVSDVSLIQIRFRNSGAQPIRKDDFEEPIQVFLSGVEEVISAEVVARDPADLPVSITNNNGQLSLTKTLLNSRDQFTVEIASIPARGVTPMVQKVTGRIAGIREIEYQSSVPTGSNQLDSKKAFGSALAGSALAIFLISLFERFRRTLRRKLRGA